MPNPEISQIVVGSALYDIKDVVARNDITTLDNEVDVLRAGIGHPIMVSSISDLTNADHSKLYLVPTTVDNETEYHWYYWDSSLQSPNWVDGGIWGDVVPIDDKLETANAAAEAKATGELKSATYGGYVFVSKSANRTWYQGTISTSSGGSQSAPNRVRTSFGEKITYQSGIVNSVTYLVKTGFALNSVEFDANGNYVRAFTYAEGAATFPVVDGCSYMFILKKTDNSNFTPSDVPDDVLTLTYYVYTDTTGTLPNKAADALTTWSRMISIVKKISLAEQLSPNLVQGSINNLGNNANSDIRIRLGLTNIWNGVNIIIPTGLKSRVFYFDENGAPVLDISDTGFTTGNRFLFPLTKNFKIVFGYTDDSVITPSNNLGIVVTRYRNTDAEMVEENIPADSSAVGNKLSELKSAIVKGTQITSLLMTWVQGDINNNGVLINSTYRCRSKTLQGYDTATYIEIQPPEGYVISIYEYNDQRAVIGNFNQILFSPTSETISFMPVTGHMYRATIQKSDSTDLTPENVPEVYADVYSATTRDSETLQFVIDAVSVLGANGDNEEIEWAQGSISVSTGLNISASNRIRSKYYMTYNSLRYLFVFCPLGYKVGTRIYEQSNAATYLKSIEFKSGVQIIPHIEGTMYKVILKRDDEDDLTPENVPEGLKIIPVFETYWSKNAHGESVAARTTKRNNPEYVAQLVAVARSYYDHRNDQTGGAYDMIYGSNSAIRQDTYTREIDCSTFASLVLRGLPYEVTPYYTKVDTPAASLVANPEYVWSFNPQYYDYYSADLTAEPDDGTRAGQLAEWMIDMGWRVPKDKKLLNLEPGDIIFYSRLNASGTAIAQPDRFMSINHVAVCVAKRKTTENDAWPASVFPYTHILFEVTGSTPCVKERYIEAGWDTPSVVNTNNYNTLSLICRPDLGSI